MLVDGFRCFIFAAVVFGLGASACGGAVVEEGGAVEEISAAPPAALRVETTGSPALNSPAQASVGSATLSGTADPAAKIDLSQGLLSGNDVCAGKRCGPADAPCEVYDFAGLLVCGCKHGGYLFMCR